MRDEVLRVCFDVLAAQRQLLHSGIGALASNGPLTYLMIRGPIRAGRGVVTQIDEEAALREPPVVVGCHGASTRVGCVAGGPQFVQSRRKHAAIASVQALDQRAVAEPAEVRSLHGRTVPRDTRQSTSVSGASPGRSERQRL